MERGVKHNRGKSFNQWTGDKVIVLNSETITKILLAVALYVVKGINESLKTDFEKFAFIVESVNNSQFMKKFNFNQTDKPTMMSDIK